MKIKVNKFLEHGAEAITYGIVGTIFAKSVEYANIITDEPNKFDFSFWGLAMIGGGIGVTILQNYISNHKTKQTEDSFFQFQNSKSKKVKLL